MKQYSFGRWVGAYYTQMQFSASYLTPVNFVMLATTLWATSRAQITDIFGWLNYPLFVGIALFTLLFLVPVLDYLFVMKPRMAYQNSQAWQHSNPGAIYLKSIDKRMEKMEKDIAEFTQSQHNNAS
jgi:hypothetical protein